jgi:hypothetical protein
MRLYTMSAGARRSSSSYAQISRGVDPTVHARNLIFPYVVRDPPSSLRCRYRAHARLFPVTASVPDGHPPGVGTFDEGRLQQRQQAGYSLACSRPTLFAAVATYGAAPRAPCSAGHPPVPMLLAVGARDGVRVRRCAGRAPSAALGPFRARLAPPRTTAPTPRLCQYGRPGDYATLEQVRTGRSGRVGGLSWRGARLAERRCGPQAHRAGLGVPHQAPGRSSLICQLSTQLRGC